MSDLDLIIEDNAAIEAAGLSLEYKFVVTSTIASLRYLRCLASDIGKPVGDISRDDIINAFKAQQARNAGPAA